MRPSRVTPWKPAITATSPASMRGDQLLGRDVVDAGAAVGVVGDDRDLPAQPGAGAARPCCAGSWPAGRRSPARRRPPPRRIRRRRAAGPGAAAPGAVGPGDQLVGLAGHGRDHHGDLVARPRPRRAPAAPTRRMRSRSATEVPPNFITSRDTARRTPSDARGRPSSDGAGSGTTALTASSRSNLPNYLSRWSGPDGLVRDRCATRSSRSHADGVRQDPRPGRRRRTRAPTSPACSASATSTSATCWRRDKLQPPRRRQSAGRPQRRARGAGALRAGRRPSLRRDRGDGVYRLAVAPTAASCRRELLALEA